MSDDQLIKVVQKQFHCRGFGRNYVGPYINTSFKFPALCKLVGRKNALTMYRKAWRSKDQTPRFKLRRGMTFDFFPNH